MKDVDPNILAVTMSSKCNKIGKKNDVRLRTPIQHEIIMQDDADIILMPWKKWDFYVTLSSLTQNDLSFTFLFMHSLYRHRYCNGFNWVGSCSIKLFKLLGDYGTYRNSLAVTRPRVWRFVIIQIRMKGYPYQFNTTL